jgi:hypothetical protein
MDPRIIHIGDQGNAPKSTAHMLDEAFGLIEQDKAWRFGMKDQTAIDGASTRRRIDCLKALKAADFDRDTHGLGCMSPPTREIKQSWEQGLTG